MKVLSLKLKDEIFKDVERMVEKQHVSRNAYINQALDFYNKFNRRRQLSKQLAKESKICRAESMKVLKEWEFIDPHLIK